MCTVGPRVGWVESSERIPSPFGGPRQVFDPPYRNEQTFTAIRHRTTTPDEAGLANDRSRRRVLDPPPRLVIACGWRWPSGGPGDVLPSFLAQLVLSPWPSPRIAGHGSRSPTGGRGSAGPRRTTCSRSRRPRSPATPPSCELFAGSAPGVTDAFPARRHRRGGDSRPCHASLMPAAPRRAPGGTLESVAA